MVSEQAGHLLLRAEDEHLVERSIGKSKKECDERGALARNSLLGDLELVDGETDQENIERLSNPKIDLRPQWMTEKKTRRLADIRPELQRCRALFANVRLFAGKLTKFFVLWLLTFLLYLASNAENGLLQLGLSVSKLCSADMLQKC